MRKYYSLFYLTTLLTVSLFAISCEENSSPPDPGKKDPTITAENKWILDYMEEAYLWNNDKINELELNYSTDYDKFLNSILNGIAGQNNVNKEDGKWENGSREHFYSYITKKPADTRAKSDQKPTTSGFGIYNLLAGRRIDDKNKAYLAILGVDPNSPSRIKGLKRGDYIIKFNGNDIANTDKDKNMVWRALVYPTNGVKISITIGIPNKTTDKYDSQKTITFDNIGTYYPNPIWLSRVLTTDNGKKVGYLNYQTFERTYDDELVYELKEFKEQNIEELVLDFRYNGGGYVVSAVTIGTAIAGRDHEGKTLEKMVFNAKRTAKGEKYSYIIGKPSNYMPINRAFKNALTGIKRVFVLTSNNTASASELIINGLRGFDIDVHLIGKQTNGKNTGMESKTKTINGYRYKFAPITFYGENHKGYRDFHGGFEPDIDVSEYSYQLFDFGTEKEILLSLAMEWIQSGAKPIPARQTRSDISTTPFAAPTPRIYGSIVLKEDITL